jgi:Family of unknown function (DUF6173)
MYSNPNFLSNFRISELPQMSAIPSITHREIPSIDLEAIREREMTDHGYAHILYERLMKQIYDFEKTLNKDEEIAAQLASFGQNILIQIEEVGYHNPFFIVFYGFNSNNGSRVQLIQHTTQLNVLFTSIKLNPEESRPARRIGFILP